MGVKNTSQILQGLVKQMTIANGKKITIMIKDAKHATGIGVILTFVSNSQTCKTEHQKINTPQFIQALLKL